MSHVREVLAGLAESPFVWFLAVILLACAVAAFIPGSRR